MRHRKTACFEALVLEPHFAQSCGLFLLLYCILFIGRCKCEIASLSNTCGSDCKPCAEYVVSVGSSWWVAAAGFVVVCCLAAISLMWLLGVP